MNDAQNYAASIPKKNTDSKKPKINMNPKEVSN